VCCNHCPDYRRSIGCNRHCPSAPQRLSSEGGLSPVEPIVAPVVFELKKLGLFHPCWSCEGHANQAGELWKSPRIWFYSDSVLHVRALDMAIDRLFDARRLSTRWRLVLTHSDPDNPDTTFSLEPELATEPSLGALQGDLRAIAADLGRYFWEACAHLVATQEQR
jgi:hypothetical protein